LSAPRHPESMLAGVGAGAGAAGSARGLGEGSEGWGRNVAVRAGAAGRGTCWAGTGVTTGAMTSGVRGTTSGVGTASGFGTASGSGSGTGCSCSTAGAGDCGSGTDCGGVSIAAGAGSNTISRTSGSGRGAIARTPSDTSASANVACNRPEAASAGVRDRPGEPLAVQRRASIVSAGNRSGRSSAGRLTLMAAQQSAQWHCRFTSACARRRFSVSSLATGVSRNIASRPPKPPCCMRRMVSARS